VHIVQICHTPVPVEHYGGTERVVEALCEGFCELGHQVTLIGPRGFRPIAGVSRINLDKFSLEMAIKKLPRSFEVIHFHLPFQDIPVELPCVYTIHGNVDDEKKMKLLPENCYFISENHAKNHLRQNFVYNGLNPRNIPLGLQKISNRDYFAFLGRAKLKRKGLSEAKLIAKRLNLPLKIGGGRRFSFNKQNQYLGQLNNQQKFQLLCQAKALLFPVLWEEPFGLVMIEALFCGTPVFALERGSVREVLGMAQAEGLALLDQSLERLIQKAINFNFDRDPMEIRQYACDNFGHIKMCQGYLKAYQKVTSNQN